MNDNTNLPGSSLPGATLPGSSIHDYQPPAASSAAASSPADQMPPADPIVAPADPTLPSVNLGATASDSSNVSGNSETMETQNIFFLLGVTDGTEQERESFLDELQQVIWEDFLENDVQLLVTDQEMVELKQIMAKSDIQEEQRQEEIVVYLEKLVPDLEEIMLEKALELKEDMVFERIAGMREYYVSNQSALDSISQAEQLAKQNKWYSAAQLLNSLDKSNPVANDTTAA